LPLLTSPNLLVGMERTEDAGVYKITEEIALVQTVDFFTPVVDDPFTFGQIAAANSLSDVYAMGGTPVTALNIMCFPVQTMDISIMREVLTGGIEKMREAGVVLVGGHSVDDREMKYGLAVTGTIDPHKILRKENARAGDKLILTKPLGTGIISTALKAGMANPEVVKSIIESMSTLNKQASIIMTETGVDACTDITGFGLIGHAAEMVEGTSKGIVIHTGAVPVFAGAEDLANQGMLPGGLSRNREFRSSIVDIAPGISRFQAEILFDPQTSGGLLIAVPENKAGILLKKLHATGVTSAAIIGEVTDRTPGRIKVEP
jgi:selenide, water dikinase